MSLYLIIKLNGMTIIEYKYFNKTKNLNRDLV